MSHGQWLGARVILILLVLGLSFSLGYSQKVAYSQDEEASDGDAGDEVVAE